MERPDDKQSHPFLNTEDAFKSGYSQGLKRAMEGYIHNAGGPWVHSSAKNPDTIKFSKACNTAWRLGWKMGQNTAGYEEALAVFKENEKNEEQNLKDYEMLILRHNTSITNLITFASRHVVDILFEDGPIQINSVEDFEILILKILEREIEYRNTK